MAHLFELGLVHTMCWVRNTLLITCTCLWSF